MRCVIAVLFLAACDLGSGTIETGPGDTGWSFPENGGQTGEDPGYYGGCEEVGATPVDLDDVPESTGFSPRQALGLAEGSWSATLRWSDETTTALVVGVETTGATAAYLHDLEPTGDTGCGDCGRMAAPATCPDYLTIDGLRLTLSTDDGLLAERATVELVAASDREALVATTWQAAELNGTFEFPDDLGDGEKSLDAEIGFDGEATHGSLTPRARAEEGNGVVSESESAPIGSW